MAPSRALLSSGKQLSSSSSRNVGFNASITRKKTAAVSPSHSRGRLTKRLMRRSSSVFPGGALPMAAEFDHVQLCQLRDLGLVVCCCWFRWGRCRGLDASLDRLGADPIGEVVEVGVALTPVAAEFRNRDQAANLSRR